MPNDCRGSIRAPGEGDAGRRKLHSILVQQMTNFGTRIVEFSTDNVPEKDRISYWREHYGHVIVRAEVEPDLDTHFRASSRTLALPGLQMTEAASSPLRISRTGRFLADGNDDVIFAINRAGSCSVTMGGREQILRDGEAIVLSGGEPTSFHRVTEGGSFSLVVPRTMFESTVVSVDDALMRPIPAERGALKLLENYAGWLLNSGPTIDQQLLNLSIRHVQDLLALTIGPRAGFAQTARTRGLWAARLKLAKSFIIANSHRHDLSVATVAATLSVTPRYLQRLFEANGTTFSEFLIGQRLAQAHRLLCEPGWNHVAISTIAYDVGFGDLSYFNRRFRRQYGATPREIRGDRTE